MVTCGESKGRPCPKGKVRKCPGDTSLARGRFPRFRDASRKGCGTKPDYARQFQSSHLVRDSLSYLNAKGIEPIKCQCPVGTGHPTAGRRVLLDFINSRTGHHKKAPSLKARELFYNTADEADKLKFGGESPLTIRYGLRADNPHPLGPSTGTA